MASLNVKRVLLSYEVPLLVLAQDGWDKSYIGVNYADGERAHLFYFSRVKDIHLPKFLEGRVDARYVVTRWNPGKYEFGECWGEANEVVRTETRNRIDPAVLPRSGMFLPEHEVASAHLKTVHIDGRWGIDDLRKFSNLVLDCYAFVFALSGRASGSVHQSIEELFKRYPWRGGFSAVNFFDDLYKLLPASERADIRRIQYASPGTIELRMNSVVAKNIRELVEEINQDQAAASLVYEDVHEWLRKKEWLGKADADLQLTRADRDELRDKLVLLCSALGLANRAQDVLAFASEDPLGAVKILLAYYRRLAALADYVATGKATDLFA